MATIEAAMVQATPTVGPAPVWWKRRLIVARGFAAHLKPLDPGCQTPLVGMLPAPAKRITPTYTRLIEIAAVVHAASTLARPLRAATYQALTSWLVVTGLRPGSHPAHPWRRRSGCRPDRRDQLQVR
jgi:hypothetical protein